MGQKQIVILITWISFFAGVYPATGQTEVNLPPLADEFSLLDQYGNCHQIMFPQEKICVLVFADKWACTQVEGWVRPLYETFQDTILIHGVALLEGVPGWLRSTLVRLFRTKIKYSVMMDWTGDICRGYGYPGGKAFVVIIDREGKIKHQVKGKASEKLIEECYNIIDGLNPNSPTSVSPQDIAMHEATSEAHP